WWSPPAMCTVARAVSARASIAGRRAARSNATASSASVRARSRSPPAVSRVDAWTSAVLRYSADAAVPARTSCSRARPGPKYPARVGGQRHQGLGLPAGDQVDDGGSSDVADGAGSVQVETPHQHRQPAEDGLLGVVEQVVAPLDGGTQVAVPAAGLLAAGEQA